MKKTARKTRCSDSTPVFLIIICGECGWIRNEKIQKIFSISDEVRTCDMSSFPITQRTTNQMNLPKYCVHHITPLLKNLQWLPSPIQKNTKSTQSLAYRCVHFDLGWFPWFAWNVCCSLDPLALVWNPCNFCLHTFVFTPKILPILQFPICL